MFVPPEQMEMVTQVKDLDTEGLTREVEMYLLRHLGDSVARMAEAQNSMLLGMADLKADIAVIKAREEVVTQLVKDVEALKLRNAQQDGAFSLMSVLKEFGPWLVAMALGAFAYFTKKT